MKVGLLVPCPVGKIRFQRNQQKFAPEEAGCYALTTFAEEVLYVGLATNLRRRMGEHLDNPEKCAPTLQGRAIWFHWIEAKEIEKIERTWMNIHIENEGRLPILNSIYSPC